MGRSLILIYMNTWNRLYRNKTTDFLIQEQAMRLQNSNTFMVTVMIKSKTLAVAILI